MKIVKKVSNLKKKYKEVKRDSFALVNASENRKKCAKYAKYYQEMKVDPNMVIYECSWGIGVIDNPYAIFKELLKRDEYKKLKHIWVLDSFEENKVIMEQYASYDNVSFVLFESDEYFVALAKAKYLINNSTFASYFTKKDEQVYINTWHGTPLKSMGFDLENGNVGSANILRNYLCADYLLAANEVMTNMYLKSYKLQGIYNGALLEEGYPRNDAFYNTEKEAVYEILEKHQIKVDRNKKIILYAPTWRGNSVGGAEVNPEELLHVKECLENNIDTEEYQILIKPHNYVYKKLRDMKEYKGLLVPSNLDANEILLISDVLISDYSSIFLDYMVTEKPILFYVPDLESYKENRGLYLEFDELPGPYSNDIVEVAGFVNNLEQIKEKYRKVYQEMKVKICGQDDGNVSKRIVDIVWEGKKSERKVEIEHEKKKLLISGGYMSVNGITESFLSLLENIDYDEWDVTVFVGRNPQDKIIEKKINNIDARARVLVKTGIPNITLDEETKREFSVCQGWYRKLWKKIYPLAADKREYRRCFGIAQFDYLVDFNGYCSTYTPMLLQGEFKKKSIWLHSDMAADKERTVNGVQKNKKALNFIISLYPEFDHIVSCSKSVMKVNRKKLGTKDTYDKYTYAKNIVNTKRIEEGLNNERVLVVNGKEYLIKSENGIDEDSKVLETVEFPNKDEINFVTMGRLSTEKNYITLLEAFGQLCEDNNNVKLYILGEGPLRPDLEAKIKELGITEKVILAGNVSNPFAIMKRCSCFILSSLYEGQPMVLLEARACNLPIIVTDFETVADSIYPNGQLVVKKDRESLYQGMNAYLKGEIPVYNLNQYDYNKEAYDEFVAAIL